MMGTGPRSGLKLELLPALQASLGWRRKREPSLILSQWAPLGECNVDVRDLVVPVKNVNVFNVYFSEFLCKTSYFGLKVKV